MLVIRDTGKSTSIFGSVNHERHIMFKPAQIILLGYIAVILLGSFILMLPGMTAPGKDLKFIDAVFTSTSAICVTGLIVVDTATFFSFWGQIVILVLIQCGGLGYMTLTTLIAIGLGRRIEYRDRLALKETFSLETPGGVVRFTLNVLKYTFTFEALGAFLFLISFIGRYPLPKAIFASIFHSISAFCNAGFSIFSNSFEDFVQNPLVVLTLCFLIISGGLGFMVLKEVITKHRILSLHSKVVIRVTILLLLAGTLLILLTEWNNPNTIGILSPGHKVLTSFFQAVTPRTAGFNTIPIRSLRSISLFIMIFLMFIGASPGGTGGGIKTTTLALLLGIVKGVAQEKNRVEYFHRRIPNETIYRAIAQTILPFLLVSVVSIIIMSYQPNNPTQIIFEVFSAFGTVGLSTGITPRLFTLSKFLLMVMMYYGKVGLLGLAIYPVKKDEKECILYPEEGVQL
jgi:trk system potassium uptake protein TrkH